MAPLSNTLKLLATYGEKISNGMISDAEIAQLCDSGLSFPRTKDLNQLEVITDFVQIIGPHIQDNALEPLAERFLAMESLLKPDDNQFMRSSTIPRVLLAYTLTKKGEKITEHPKFTSDHPIPTHFKLRAVEQYADQEEVKRLQDAFTLETSNIKSSSHTYDELFMRLTSLQKAYIHKCNVLYQATQQQHCGGFFEIDIDPESDYTLIAKKMRLSNLATLDTVILYQDELYYLRHQDQHVEKLNIQDDELAETLKEKCKTAHVADTSEVALIREASGHEQTVQNRIDISIKNATNNTVVVIAQNYRHFQNIYKSEDPLVLLALAISALSQEDSELRNRMIALMETAQQLLTLEDQPAVKKAIQSALGIITKKIEGTLIEKEDQQEIPHIKHILANHLTMESTDKSDDIQIKKGFIEQLLELLTWVWEALFGKKQCVSVSTEPTVQNKKNEYKQRFLDTFDQTLDAQENKHTPDPDRVNEVSDSAALCDLCPKPTLL